MLKRCQIICWAYWFGGNDVKAVFVNLQKEISSSTVQFSSKSEDTQDKFTPLRAFSLTSDT